MNKKEQRALEALLTLAFVSYRSTYARPLSEDEIKDQFNKASDCLSDEDKEIIASWPLF